MFHLFSLMIALVARGEPPVFVPAGIREMVVASELRCGPMTFYFDGDGKRVQYLINGKLGPLRVEWTKRRATMTLVEGGEPLILDWVADSRGTIYLGKKACQRIEP